MNNIEFSKKNILFVISAPSGSGKTTLIDKLEKENVNIKRCITYTTRKPRKDETDGKDYIFISEEEFKKKIEKQEFLEYVKIFDNYYGTTKKIIDRIIEEKKHAFLVIDTEGAQKIKEKMEAVFIFIAPPSMEELKRRLLKRNSEDIQNEQQRLEEAKKEMQKIKNYNYLIINDKLDEAYQVLKAIVIAEEYRINTKKDLK